ncbi:hypothetical protein EMCRGX_G007781 [Ephydatia muelleri]
MAVMREVHYYENTIRYLPEVLKTKMAMVLAKRGMLSERTMNLVLHKGILELDLSAVRSTLTSQAFCSFFLQCRMLQIVNLKCCTLMDNNAVMCLVESCAYLVCLCLAGCHMISDKALHSIAQKCRYLQALDLAKTKVSTDGLVAFKDACCSKFLKELNISHCLNVTDEAVEVLFTHCPRLSILVFHGCPRLTSHSYDVASTCAGLKQISWTIY